MTCRPLPAAQPVSRRRLRRPLEVLPEHRPDRPQNQPPLALRRVAGAGIAGRVDGRLPARWVTKAYGVCERGGGRRPEEARRLRLARAPGVPRLVGGPLRQAAHARGRQSRICIRLDPKAGRICMRLANETPPSEDLPATRTACERGREGRGWLAGETDGAWRGTRSTDWGRSALLSEPPPCQQGQRIPGRPDQKPSIWRSGLGLKLAGLASR